MLLSVFYNNAFSNDLNNENHEFNTVGDSLTSAPFILPQRNGSFKLDGIIEDPCWNKLSPLKLVMHIHTFGNQSTENSEVFICHDNEYVYVGGRFFDKEANKINYASRMRDNIGSEEDGFFIFFDTFNDHENSVGFHTNVAGVREDMTIAKDGTESDPWNNSLNFCQYPDSIQQYSIWYGNQYAVS